MLGALLMIIRRSIIYKLDINTLNQKKNNSQSIQTILKLTDSWLEGRALSLTRIVNAGTSTLGRDLDSLQTFDLDWLHGLAQK